MKERPKVTRDSNSRVTVRLDTSTFPLLELVNFGSYVWQPVHLGRILDLDLDMVRRRVSKHGA